MEYVLNNYFFILYVITLILSIIRYRLYYDTILKYFPILIGYALVGEVLGLLVRDVEGFQIIYDEDYTNYNAIIFNVFDIIFFLYFYYVFWTIIKSKNSKSFICIGAILFIITSLINPFLQNFYMLPQNYAILMGSVILIVGALSYVLELSAKEATLGTNIFFWISIGILIFYSFYPITMYILTFQYDSYNTYQLSNLHYLLITLLYSCFIIGLLNMKRVKPIIQNT